MDVFIFILHTFLSETIWQKWIFHGGVCCGKTGMENLPRHCLDRTGVARALAARRQNPAHAGYHALAPPRASPQVLSLAKAIDRQTLTNESKIATI